MKFPIKVIYVCGSISAPTSEQRDLNLEKGKQIGFDIWKLGAAPLVPHMNSVGLLQTGITLEAIYLGDLALLSKCDAMYVMDGWENSFGCNLEIAWAKNKNIPIFRTLEDLDSYIRIGTLHS
jgi:Domain of unknown function (DUF4406)